MLLKLAALGALGYVGYKVYQNNADQWQDDTGGTSSRRQGSSSEPNLSDSQVALAGGPLSDQAKVVEAGRPITAN